MFVTSNLKVVLALGLAIIGSSAHADEIVEGPLIAAGLWEESTRAIAFDWEEYPSAIKVSQDIVRRLVCERGVRSGGKWFRYADNVLIRLGEVFLTRVRGHRPCRSKCIAETSVAGILSIAVTIRSDLVWNSAHQV